MFPNLHTPRDRHLSAHLKLLLAFLNSSDGRTFLLILQSQLRLLVPLFMGPRAENKANSIP